jgi:Tfp pilus assembly protein PilF
MINRNAPCSCGSGKRYKHCCGQDGAPTARRRRRPGPRRWPAHRAGSLRLAESLYRRALEENPRDVDVLHMLGVVQLERLRYREALDLILEAAERTDWKLPQVRHNLGLVLAKLLVRGDDARKSLVDAFLAWEQSQRTSLAA